MLNAQFDGDVLKVQPGGPITTDDVRTLTRTVDDYLTDHPKIDGVMMQTRTFPGFASMGSFADYARFIADNRRKVQRVALVTDFALAPVAEFMANHVVGVKMRHFPFADDKAALAWLRST
jgi:SpoIIAA-like